MKLIDPNTTYILKTIVRENPRTVAIVCALLIVSSLFEAVGISAAFPLISVILETNASLPDSDFSDVINSFANWGPYWLSGFIVTCFVLKSLIMWFTVTVIAKNVAGYSHELRTTFVNAMLNAKLEYLISRRLGESLAILSNDSIRAAHAFTAAARIFAGLFQVVIYFAYALWLSVEATFLSMAAMFVMFFLIMGTMKSTRRAGENITKYIHDITQSMSEALRGVKEAKASAREQYLKDYIIDESDQLRDAHQTSISVGQILRNIQDPITVISALICLLIFKEGMDFEPGYILFILAVYYRLIRSTNQTVTDYQKFIGFETSLRAIKDGTGRAVEQAEDFEPNGIDADRKPQLICFDKVSMRYGENIVFTDLSFEVPANKFTVLLGESGTGKTTCIDLICRLVEPVSGKITVGEVPLENINTKSWRKGIGYVDQFPFMYAGSIKENILLDKEDVTDDELQDCIKQCNLEEFVNSLPDGLDTKIEEDGGNISGGQRQRIAIARSVIRKPSYIILDEPTSALDSMTAENIFKMLSALSEKMSVIVISHSEMSEKYADKVIRLK